MRYNVFVYAKISGKNLQINNQVGCNTIMDWKFKIKKKNGFKLSKSEIDTIK